MKNRLIALALVVAFTGCATLFAGGTAVPVMTNPPGAYVYVNGVPVGQTPTQISLNPELPANVQIYLPGFQPVQLWKHKGFSGWFWVNILFWPGFIVDLATGKYQRYDDNAIAIGLTPSNGPAPDWYQQQPPPGPQQPMPPAPGPIQPGQPVPPPPPTN